MVLYLAAADEYDPFMDLPQTFGCFLKHLLKEQKLTRPSVVQRGGLDNSTFGRYLKGEQLPGRENFQKIAKGFALGTKDLLSYFGQWLIDRFPADEPIDSHQLDASVLAKARILRRFDIATAPLTEEQRASIQKVRERAISTLEASISGINEAEALLFAFCAPASDNDSKNSDLPSHPPEDL